MLVDELLAATRQGSIAQGMLWPLHSMPCPAGPFHPFTLPLPRGCPLASIHPGWLRISSRWRATVQDLFLIHQLEASEVVAAAEIPHNCVLNIASAGCLCPAGAR